MIAMPLSNTSFHKMLNVLDLFNRNILYTLCYHSSSIIIPQPDAALYFSSLLASQNRLNNSPNNETKTIPTSNNIPNTDPDACKLNNETSEKEVLPLPNVIPEKALPLYDDVSNNSNSKESL
jgi:hypothetical protein